MKEILARHSCQRPPFSILIFSQEEIAAIMDFMLKTYFRHFSLYEYSFKPKVDLLLMTVPKEYSQSALREKEQAASPDLGGGEEIDNAMEEE